MRVTCTQQGVDFLETRVSLPINSPSTILLDTKNYEVNYDNEVISSQACSLMLDIASAEKLALDILAKVKAARDFESLKEA